MATVWTPEAATSQIGYSGPDYVEEGYWPLDWGHYDAATNTWTPDSAASKTWTPEAGL